MPVGILRFEESFNGETNQQRRQLSRVLMRGPVKSVILEGLNAELKLALTEHHIEVIPTFAPNNTHNIADVTLTLLIHPKFEPRGVDIKLALGRYLFTWLMSIVRSNDIDAAGLQTMAVDVWFVPMSGVVVSLRDHAMGPGKILDSWGDPKGVNLQGADIYTPRPPATS